MHRGGPQIKVQAAMMAAIGALCKAWTKEYKPYIMQETHPVHMKLS
jgi:hypothetical protein